MPIERLAPELCNQIAAGEVVERPASVVKELVENSIDAEATRVDIEIGAGGVGLIRISDDGIGMDERDAILSLERHATSKISRFNDLLALNTFGFRGEALPSIASVSDFSLKTRQRHANEGVRVTMSSGGIVDSAPCGMAPGTIVEVKELLHNVPARRKFLKSTAAESAAITGVVESLALASPGLTFTLHRDGKLVRQWLRAEDRAERVRQLFPETTLRRFSSTRGPLQLEAFLSPPEQARSGANGLILVINGRVIRDRILARVIAQAYGSVLDPGRYPVGVAHLSVAPDLIDVNVHPQKAEVRFANPKQIQDGVYAIVSEGLAGAFGLAPPSRMNWRPSAPAPSPPQSMQTPPWERHQAPSVPTHPVPLATREKPAQEDPWGLSPTVSPSLEPLQQTIGLVPASPPSNMIAQEAEEPKRSAYASLRFLAQVRQMFLLCEAEDGLVIIDQHAAAERVTYARLRDAYRRGKVASQRLLIPVTIPLDSEQQLLLEESASAIAETGMELRVLGPASAAILAVPKILERGNPEQLARDLMDELGRLGGRHFSDALDMALATMACHGSLRSGDPISREEAEALLLAMDQVEFGGHCPHGRPLLMRIPFHELERQVGRK